MSNENRDGLKLAILVLAAVFAAIAPFAMSDTGDAVNYRNASATSTVNITNSFPEVVNVFPDTGITLNAGGVQNIECNATVRDFDGAGTITNVNATFFDQNVASLNDPDDNNNHYTNTSCTQYAVSGTTANYTCGFPTQYYANNGTNWNCTVEVIDDQSTTDNDSVVTDINALLALNVTSLIDFGNLAVTDISSPQEANVTNFGNTQINVSVYGYGNVSGDGLAMICETGNISVEEERYSFNSTGVWADMQPLSATNQLFENLTLVQRTDDAASGVVFNSTYWTLRVPASSNPSGTCNGTIVFQAESS